MNWIKVGAIGVATLFLGILLIGKWNNSLYVDQPAETYTDLNTATTTETNRNEDLVKQARQIYTDSNTAVIAGIEDREMANYIANVILVKCPFYEPDGVSYRECLINLREKAENNFRGSKTTLEVFGDYCHNIAKEYEGSLVAGELWNQCMIYKLSSADIKSY